MPACHLYKSCIHVVSAYASIWHTLTTCEGCVNCISDVQVSRLPCRPEFSKSDVDNLIASRSSVWGVGLHVTDTCGCGQVPNMFMDDYAGTVAYTNAKTPADDGLIWLLIDRV
jgi:hypothetical protein